MKSLITEGRHRSLLLSMVLALLAPLLVIVMSSSATAEGGTTMQVMFTEDCFDGGKATVMNTSPNKTGTVTAQVVGGGYGVTDYQIKPGDGVTISTGLYFNATVSVQTIDDMRSPAPVATDWGTYAWVSGDGDGCPPMIATAKVVRWGKHLTKKGMPHLSYKTTAWRTDVGYRRVGKKRISWSGYFLQAGKYRMLLPVVKPGRRVKYEIFSRNGDAGDHVTEPIKIGSKRFKRHR